MISKKIFKEIERVRKEFKKEIIDKIGSNNTIQIYSQIYEAYFYEGLRGSHVIHETKLKAIVAEIIRWVSHENFVEDKEISSLDYSTYKKYFFKAYEVEQSNSAFISNFAELFEVKILSENKLQFKYKNTEIQKMEHINHILISEYLDNKGRISQVFIDEAKEDRKEITIDIRTQAILKAEFELPEDYRVLGYSILQIKEFWSLIFKDTMTANKDNGNYFKGFVEKNKEIHLEDVRGFRLVDITVDDWELKNINKEQVAELLEIFSYTGKKKFNTINSTFTTEPIIKMPNGDYKVIPSSLSGYQAERYSMQVFDKLIDYYQNVEKEEVLTDDMKREFLFVDKLNILFKQFKYKKDTVKLNDTDIDYIVYDEKSKTVLCFETKWLIEPLTPVEISSKDKALQKALEVQLPKYKKEMESNTQELLNKAFGKDFNETPYNFFYFALTNLSIGSGMLDRSNFKVINIRMLEKGMKDSNGSLLSLSHRLEANTYLPKLKSLIDNKVEKTVCFGIEVRQPVFKYHGGFSLS